MGCSSIRRPCCLALALLLPGACLLLLSAAPCAAAAAATGAAAAAIRGRVTTAADGATVVPLDPGTVLEVVLTSSSGEKTRTFAERDGSFVLRDVAPGVHVISAYNRKFVFPEVRVDVSQSGTLEGASLVFNGAPIPISPLIIRSAGIAQYYEPRKPLDVIGFLKSPYGLMIGFSVFAMVIMPMMKVDPEEYREAMAQLRGDGGGAGGQAGGGGGAGAGGGGGAQQRRQIRDR